MRQARWWHVQRPSAGGIIIFWSHRGVRAGFEQVRLKFSHSQRLHSAHHVWFWGFAGSAAPPRCRATELLAFARNRIVTLARQSAIAPPRIEACDGKIGSILRGLLKGVKSASFRRYAIWCKGLSILQELPCGCSIPRKSSPDTPKTSNTMQNHYMTYLNLHGVERAIAQCAGDRGWWVLVRVMLKTWQVYSLQHAIAQKRTTVPSVLV